MNIKVTNKYASSQRAALAFYLWSTDAIFIAIVGNLLNYGLQWLAIFSYSWQAVLFVHIGAFILSVLFIFRGLHFEKIYYNKQYAFLQKLEQYRDLIKEHNLVYDLNLLKRFDSIKLNKDSHNNLMGNLSNHLLKVILICCNVQFLFLIINIYISSNTQSKLYTFTLLLAVIITQVKYRSKYLAKARWYKLIDDKNYLLRLNAEIEKLKYSSETK